MSTINFNSTFEYKLIYIFRINDKAHKGHLKIGEATLHTSKNFSEFQPNNHDLNVAARQRIDSYTVTAGIVYDLLHTEIAVYEKNGKIKAFRDYKVHEVLKRSGILPKRFEFNRKPSEWYPCDLETAKNAIKAVKEGASALNSSQISNDRSPIVFRPEQLDAIKRTIARFKTDDRMLWNAKMRFGKTLTALEVAKQKEFKKTIIITHKPVVADGWFEDFDKIFYDKPDYYFGSKTKGKNLKDLLKNNDNFVYFASMQDLRGSDAVGGNFNKNDDVFQTNWDFVVVDEAHEGTQTKLGKEVLEAVIKPDNDYKTYILELSGTPFNLLTSFENDSIYTWDYIMEQEAKAEWDLEHFGDSNPYEELPRMNIFTYHLEKSLPVYIDVMDKAFNFREFFSISDVKAHIISNGHRREVFPGDFIHEQDVEAFLDLICKRSDISNYPYSTDEYRDYFRHSLWVVPGVKEAKALEKLLKHHRVFREFEIVNVAGEGGEEIDTNDALSALKSKITDHPENTRTITLSCGRLTTGVTVPEWTAVLMLAGTYSTAASQYLQTIFRVQSPANINGKVKSECYVFDFAPDRTLKMVAESVQLSARAGANNSHAELSLKQFLNYCPVIAIEDSNMKEYKVSELLQELKKAYAERVARNGFDDPKIYNDELLKLTAVELKEFENLKKIVGASKQTKKAGIIDINSEGFNIEEAEEETELRRIKKKDLTEEQKKRIAELKEKRKNRDAAISILRAISIRMPLLVYGMDIDIETDVTIDNFADLIDDTSWLEFMPTGVDKPTFKKFSKYYDKDIFIAASRRIRYIAKTADELEPTERVQRIASLFNSFKNPDKETILTPWRVVNMHLSDTVGGYDFFNLNHSYSINEPRLVTYEDVTNNVFNKDSKILEINSKTGLYPLYVTYSLYRMSINDLDNPSFEKKVEIWDKVVKEQVFVICKTPMAKLITKRTLLGYRSGKINMHSFNDLIMQLKEKQTQFIQKVLKPSFWNIGGNGKMKFNAVVGNPPYQEVISSSEDNSSLSRQLFPSFVQASIGLRPQYISLITPSRWFAGDAQDKSFLKLREYIKANNHFRKLFIYPSSNDVFSNVIIKGGVSYYLIDNNYSGVVDFYIKKGDIKEKQSRPLFENGLDIILGDAIQYQIILKVKNSNFISIDTITKGRNAFGIVGKPEIVNKISQANYADGLVSLRCKNNEIRYTEPINITKNIDVFNNYKVFVSKSAGDPVKDTKVIGTPHIANPREACTDSLIPIGSFKSLVEATNLAKYLKTKFARYMISILKVSQNVYQNVYQFIPIQDFTDNSDIDWGNTISGIDKQLFEKYGLSSEEIAFINDSISEMG